MATGDKLFYTYNSPWIHDNSLKYSENYTYSMILNKKNHKIIHDGVEYGTFHNSNYIACLPSDAFINETNSFNLSPANSNYFCIKVPAQASNWNSGDISFDVILSSEFGHAKYRISGKLGSGQGTTNKSWINPNAVCISNQSGPNTNGLNNLDVRFINYRCRVVGSTHCYWPVVAIGPTEITTGATLPISINVSNISTTNNLSGNISYNFIDTSANLDHKWETSLKTSLDATYYVETTITNPLVQAHSANQFTHTVNIWGQEFDGTNNVAGDFTLNDTNNWNKFQNGSDNSSYLLRTTYLRVNSDNTSRNYVLDVEGGSKFGGYVGIGWQPQIGSRPTPRLYITGMVEQPRVHPSSNDSTPYALFTEYGLHYLGEPVGICTHPVLDGNTAGGSDGRGAILTVRSTYNDDNRNPIAIYTVSGDNIFKNGDTSIGINTYLGSPSRKLFVHGDGNSNYAIYSENGLNYFNSRVGIGVEPNNTSYALNVNGKIWAQSGVNVYGQGSMLNATQNCAININNISSASWDQVVKVFCINSLQNDDVYTYWHCGIYTMKNSDRKWAYDTEASTAYNLLLYTATTSVNGPQCLYAFNTNPDYKGTVALNEGTAYNLVCLGVISIYRASAGSPWAATRIAGNLNPSTIVQPTASSTVPGSSSVGNSGVKITFTLSSTKHISKSTINICSAIPVINTMFYKGNTSSPAPPDRHVALNSGISITNNIIQMYAQPSTSSTNTNIVSNGIVVWGTRYDARELASYDDVMINSSANGYPASIRVTLFGYYS